MARPFGHVTVLEGGRDMELTQAQAAALEGKGLIYRCPPEDGGCFVSGEGCGFYHVSNSIADLPDMWDRLATAIPLELM